jgi:hypothetical protein
LAVCVCIDSLIHLCFADKSKLDGVFIVFGRVERSTVEYFDHFVQMFLSWTTTATGWIPVAVSVVSAIWATLTALSNHVDRVKLSRPRKLCAVRIRTRHDGGVEDLDERKCESILLFLDRVEIQRKREIDDLNKSFGQWVSVECYPVAQVVSFRAEQESPSESWFDRVMGRISRLLRISGV